MSPKISMELSDTHIKVLDELELLTDAYISTFTQIGKTINGFSAELSKVVGKFLSERPSWRKYPSHCYDLAYKPFYYDWKGESLIDVLSIQFAVEGRIAIVKELKESGKKKEVDYFQIYWGFYYDKDNDPDPDKYFYFDIYRNAKIHGGSIMNLDEYNYLLNKENEVRIDYTQEHPENGDVNESIELWLDYPKKENLSNLFTFFKDELLTNFISNSPVVFYDINIGG